MVQFTPKIHYPFPKPCMEQDELRYEIRKDARMIQRAYDYFQSSIKAGNIGLPNSRRIKDTHLSNARSLEPVYKFEDCTDDEGEFPESWITVPGAMRDILNEFEWYAPTLLNCPDKRLVSLTELMWGEKGLENKLKYWEFMQPRKIVMEACHSVVKPRVPVYKPLEFERVEYKPFAEYQKFKPVVPYEPTKEELAETERLRKQSEACGTPSQQTARCYLFDLIDTSPSARETLEKQAREDPKAAFHIELLKKKKATAAKEDPESLHISNEGDKSTEVTNEISSEVDDQKEIVRQMYSVGISKDNDNDNDKVFQIEQGPLKVLQSRRFPKPVLRGCPTGILIDF